MEMTDEMKKEIEYFSALFMYLGARRDNGTTNNMECLGIFSSNGTNTEEEETEDKLPDPEIKPLLRKGKLWYPKVNSKRLNLETGKYNAGMLNPKEYYDKHKHETKHCDFCNQDIKLCSFYRHTRSKKCKKIGTLLQTNA
jgi:hypothetical protein